MAARIRPERATGLGSRPISHLPCPTGRRKRPGSPERECCTDYGIRLHRPISTTFPGDDFRPERGITPTRGVPAVGPRGPVLPMARSYEEMSIEAALEELDSPGQKYVHAHTAFEILAAFGENADGFGDTYDLSERLEEEQKSCEEARGILTVWPHDMVMTIEDISAILVGQLGEEPSTANMLGTGSTADVRHEQNMVTIRDFGMEKYEDSDFEADEGDATEGSSSPP